MMSEDRLQQECVMWFNNEYPHLRGLLFSVPNGGKRDRREAALLKSTGLYPGVADLVFLYRRQTYFLELKTEKGVQSTVQKDWQSKVKEHGFNYYIIRRTLEFRYAIKSIIE